MSGHNRYLVPDDEERAREAVNSILALGDDPPHSKPQNFYEDRSDEQTWTSENPNEVEPSYSQAERDKDRRAQSSFKSHDRSRSRSRSRSRPRSRSPLGTNPEEDGTTRTERDEDKPIQEFNKTRDRSRSRSPHGTKQGDDGNAPTTSQSASPEQKTLCNVVAAHYNNVPETGLDERSKSRILYLRNFNNWIKSMLIDEYITKVRESKPRGSTLRVLDMGCGKGGDLFKWRQGKITHLVAADIAATSVEQCKERYNDMRQRAQRERNFNPIFSAQFIVANCTKDRLRHKYEDVTMQFDLVSCQFAFHYCFESLPQAECMMRNASECLRPGGFFFGSCPNANAIISRVRKAGGKRFGNDVFSVEFETPVDEEEPPPLFGAQYNFHMEGVVDCPEFLVHFPTFIRLASRFGLKFIGCEPFQAFYERMKENGRGLLGRMQALETYPPFPDQPLMGPLSQYEHADTFLNTNKQVNRLGTLSKAEWEAATLYCIFVFEKESS
ncbi:mRNA cap guanine-N7 methyltransferase [Thrips palmi]|uniref:mRNA cap guanine-N(7) methyltransferase n=1 Tax=Thrips palmi TaxID=161013 RepID=A0A6P8ZQB3_THRPL|nr:mRNA cap guanine-N7 methyltransferase [Thrips palmi]